MIHHARIRAEQALHRAMIDGIDLVPMATLDELLAVPICDGGPSRDLRMTTWHLRDLAQPWHAATVAATVLRLGLAPGVFAICPT